MTTALTETLVQLEKNLTCMDAALAGDMEESAKEALSLLRQGTNGESSSVDLIATRGRIGRLRVLAGSASSLYLGWLNVAKSVSCGYTATGPAQPQHSPRFIAEG